MLAARNNSFYGSITHPREKQSEQVIHRHQTPPRYRNAASHASSYGRLRPDVTSSINRKYITYRNAARGESSHGHRGSAHKISWRSVQRFQRYARGQRDRQTDTQTDGLTDRQADHNTPFPCRGGV